MNDATGRQRVPEEFEQAWEHWHAARERSLASDYGWLSLTAFEWLPAEAAPLADLPGTWSAHDATAVLRASAVDGLRLESAGKSGEGLIDGVVTAMLDDEGSLAWVRHGDRLVELARRGGRYAVRVRDPHAPTRTEFTGVAHFRVDPAWVSPGRFIAFDAPRTVTIATARADLDGAAVIVGTVHVRHAGLDYPLAATAGGGGSLTLTFHDVTNGVTTALWRFVSTSAPDTEGRLTVDFNRALNYPSAFTDFGTCPAPVAGNTLPFAVTAGERRAR